MSLKKVLNQQEIIKQFSPAIPLAFLVLFIVADIMLLTIEDFPWDLFGVI